MLDVLASLLPGGEDVAKKRIKRCARGTNTRMESVTIKPLLHADTSMLVP